MSERLETISSRIDKRTAAYAAAAAIAIGGLAAGCSDNNPGIKSNHPDSWTNPEDFLQFSPVLGAGGLSGPVGPHPLTNPASAEYYHFPEQM
jgi:hypothetical protein